MTVFTLDDARRIVSPDLPLRDALKASVTVLGPDSPRKRLLASLLRLESAGVEAAAACRRIYCAFLADDIDLPCPKAIASCIRLLAPIDDAEVTAALLALADMISPLGEGRPGPEAA